MTTGTLALVIVIVILAQAVVAALIGLNRRRRQFRELDGRGAESGAPSRSPKPVRPPVDAWAGFREFVVQRREPEDRDQTVCSFYLAPCDGEPLAPFQPGQFLTFRLFIEDATKPQSSAVVRCYSLSDAPRPDYYRVSIKRVPAPPDRPDLPPGSSSGFFHDRVHEGVSGQ